MQLTPTQQLADTKFSEWLTSCDPKPFILRGGAGCVDKDTEFLTTTGWKRISEYKPSDLVAEWDSNSNELSYKKPKRYIAEPCVSMYQFKTTTVDMVLSDEHRIPIITSKSNHKVITTTEALSRRKFTIPRTFSDNKAGLALSDALIRVAVMQAADGSIDKNVKHSCAFHINVKKERKQLRVEQLLADAGIPYTIQKSGVGYKRYYYTAPKEIAFKGLPNLWGMSLSQAEVIAEEVLEWDGCKSTHSFSGNRLDSDVVQYAWSIVYGTYCSISKDHRTYVNGDIFTVSKSSRKVSEVLVKPYADKPSALTKFTTVDGFKYCFTTSTGFWLARRNGKIFPTGNSGKTFTTMNVLIPALIEHRSSFTLTSTTHQANEMLMANTPDKYKNLQSITIHVALGLVPWSGKCIGNPERFRECGYKMRMKPDIYDRDILIIDEAFRIDEMLYSILKYLKPNARYVFIGDPYQTPPVGSDKSVLEDIEAVSVTLREAPRFINGGTLGKVVTKLREHVEFEKQNPFALLPEEDVNIKLGKRSVVGKHLTKLLDSGAPILDNDFCILTGTKQGEYGYNNYILNYRKDNGMPLVNAGESFNVETVISAYSMPSDTAQYMRKKRKFTKELLDSPDFEWKHQKYGMTAQNDQAVLVLVTPWAKHDINDDFYKLVKLCREYGKDVVVLRLNIARTIHLAQGLTCSNVCVDLRTIRKWSSRDMHNRLLYTAVSRASDKVVYFE